LKLISRTLEKDMPIWILEKVALTPQNKSTRVSTRHTGLFRRDCARGTLFLHHAVPSVMYLTMILNHGVEIFFLTMVFRCTVVPGDRNWHIETADWNLAGFFTIFRNLLAGIWGRSPISLVPPSKLWGCVSESRHSKFAQLIPVTR